MGKNMRIALVYDEKQVLKPLDEGEILGIIDEERKVVEQYENPGFNKDKESTMNAIIQLGAQAIIVKDDSLDKASYEMSRGHIVYYPISKYNNLYDVIENLNDVKSNPQEKLPYMEGAQ
ncbi:MAG: hypothetical protein G5Z43_000478 [Caldisphaeraceae archaeon]|nr:hypothetical protein [Caldisphaeraceae archaeon]